MENKYAGWSSTFCKNTDIKKLNKLRNNIKRIKDLCLV